MLAYGVGQASGNIVTVFWDLLGCTRRRHISEIGNKIRFKTEARLSDRRGYPGP